MRSTLLLSFALTACFGHGSSGDDGATDGGDAPADDTGDPCIDIEPLALTALPDGRVCEMPVGCVSLPEAVDRGAVAISYTGAGLTLENIDSTFDVCMDGWYLFMSGASQDTGAGDPGDGDDDDDDGDGDDGDGDDGVPDIDDGGSYDGSSSSDGSDGPGADDPCDDTEPPPPQLGGRITLAPLQAISFAYGGSGAGLEADSPTWWCVEETQTTAATDSFSFNGARMPQPLLELALDQTDLDGDGVEDHVDGLQTNANIWAFQRDNPVFSIGRDRSFVEMGRTRTERVTLEVTNMGRVSDTVTFTETLPPGVTAANFSRPPAEIETTPRGWTVLRWKATIDGAIDTASNVHTEYGSLRVSYDVGLADGASCPLRYEGRAPQARWDTDDARHWTSVGTPLILSCCSR